MVLPFCPLLSGARAPDIADGGWMPPRLKATGGAHRLKIWFYNVYVMFGGILHHLPFKRKSGVIFRGHSVPASADMAGVAIAAFFYLLQGFAVAMIVFVTVMTLRAVFFAVLALNV
jgi:hypothetical protein